MIKKIFPLAIGTGFFSQTTLILIVAALLVGPGCRAVYPQTAKADNKAFKKYGDVSGYINITEIGGAMGLGQVSADRTGSFISISTINGYVIDNHFMTGLGLGLHSYNGDLLAPVYLDIRYHFREHNFTPFIYGDGGLLVNFAEAPGFFLNPGVGIIGKINDKFALTLSSGIFVQRAPDFSTFINVKLGIIFGNNHGSEPCPLSSVRRR